MARRLWAALIALSMTFCTAFYSVAQAQEPDSVATRWVCTERGAMAALQAFTRSHAAAEEVLRSPECLIFPRALVLQIAARTAGPVEDFEGDEMWVVEVGTSRPVERRFTLAWPGINARFAGQGA